MAQQKDMKHCLEAARAASLAAHSAAGLATAVGAKEAARLLRAAEALARSAVAVLASTSSTTPSTCSVSGVRTPRVVPPRCATSDDIGKDCGAGLGTSSSGKPQRRRRNRRKQHPKENAETGDRKIVNASAEGRPASDRKIEDAKFPPAGNIMELQAKEDVVMAVDRPRRALARHETLPKLPTSATMSSSSSSTRAPTDLVTNHCYMLTGLAQRPELNGKKVKFLRFCVETSRLIVQLVDVAHGMPAVGDPIRVKHDNLVACAELDPGPRY